MKKQYIIIFLILAAGIFYFSTIRHGHDWGGDFSMYIRHASKLVEGRDYDDSIYIYNPLRPFLAPNTYPPVYPFLIAPLYKIFGNDLFPLKIELIIFFLLALFVIYLTLKDDLPLFYVVLIISFIAFNPFLWNFKDQVRPDFPFLFFTYMTFFLINRYYRSEKSKKKKIIYSLITGLFIYLAYGTRSIGMVFIPSLYIYELIRYKKLTVFSILSTVVFGLVMLAQSLLFHSDSTYVEMFKGTNPATMVNNFFHYAYSPLVLWENGYFVWLKLLLFSVIGLLSIAGYFFRLKEKPGIFEIFVAIYIGTIVLFPGFDGIRYLIPLIPLYLYYVFFSIHELGKLKRRSIEKFFVFFIILAVSFSYIMRYTHYNFAALPEGTSKKETRELFEFIKSQIKEDAVFIYIKPRIISHYTERRASAIPDTQIQSEIMDYCRSIKATHLISGPPQYGEYLKNFIHTYNKDLKIEFSNNDFVIYRFHESFR